MKVDKDEVSLAYETMAALLVELRKMKKPRGFTEKSALELCERAGVALSKVVQKSKTFSNEDRITISGKNGLEAKIIGNRKLKVILTAKSKDSSEWTSIEIVRKIVFA